MFQKESFKNNIKVKDEKLQCNINGEAPEISSLLSRKLIKMNILQLKKYCHLIKVEQQNQQGLHTPLLVKHLKNK